LIALGFLLYTLINLDALEIPVTHPRVIVEFSLFLAFLLIGVLLISQIGFTHASAKLCPARDGAAGRIRTCEPLRERISPCGAHYRPNAILSP
jgi:hypothetical protein